MGKTTTNTTNEPESPVDARQLFEIEEADAWFEYLEATQGKTGKSYDETEPWAWARLSQRRRAIATRRKKVA